MTSTIDFTQFSEYHPDFFNQSSEEIDTLIAEINWRRDEIKLFGKAHLIPRHHAWYGDQGAHYSYSGISLPVNGWSPQLRKLKARVEEKVGVTFNGVLCNLYESGLHSNGWHSDDEKELVRPITVASVSLGEQRTFQLRRKGQTRIEARVELESGSLFIMKAPFQEKWQHQIAKSKKVLGKRLNLTFRRVEVSLG